MHLYWLSTSLLAVAGLLLATGMPVAAGHSYRLLPFYLLVISRLGGLVFSLLTVPLAQSGMGGLEVFSTFCVVWILVGTVSKLPVAWIKLAWAGVGGALLLSFLPIFPAWPIPVEIHSLAIAVFSPIILIAGWGEIRWPHLASPLALALANFLQLFGLVNLAWFIALFAYAFLIYAVHRDTLLAYRQLADEQQLSAKSQVEEALTLNQEQQRWLDISKAISGVPSLNETTDHMVRTLVRFFRVDQAAIFVLNPKVVGQARLAAYYSPERAFSLAEHGEITLTLDEYPPLQLGLEQRKQLLYPPQNIPGLEKLVALWYEDNVGPTLIQPLSVQGRPVGLLVLSNAHSRRPVSRRDARLCGDLAGQMAVLVDYCRRYVDLETEAEIMAAAVQQQVPLEAITAPGSGLLPDRSAEFEAYQAIFHAISDGVILSDSLGRIRWVNQAAEHILGQPRQDLIGQSIGVVYGKIDSGEPIEDLMVSFSRRNQPLPTFIEDDNRAIQGRLIPWRNSDHEWLGIVAVFRDVTREVKADRARNDFIAALSRELRSPLTAVKGYSELITNGLMNDYSPEQLRVQRIINTSADRMVTVLDNAIQVTAENRHQILPRFEEINVAKIMTEALREAAPLIQLRELTLLREVEPNLPAIAADPRHFRRILDNLLSNACRFTPPGGQVTVRVNTISERVGNKFHPRLQLSVADNGIGIAAGETKRIFDPFYQVNNQNVDEESGMGMGLAVVKELVQLHKGRVWVDSTLGKGSVFNVVLPVTQEY